MYFSISAKTYSDILYAIFEGLKKSIPEPNLSEPQLVANIVYNIPNEINRVSGAIKCGGIFVHQQPFVEYSNMPDPKQKSVEIGDLLLLRSEINNGREISTSAMLLQAKKNDKFPIIPDNENQHYLYAHWPVFKYCKKSGDLTGQQRCINGLDVYNACKYLIFSESYIPFCYPDSNPPAIRRCFFDFIKLPLNTYTAHPSWPYLSSFISFPQELLNFIIGNAGKLYISSPPQNDGNWSGVINDLKTITANHTSVIISRTTGIPHTKRGVSLFFSGDSSCLSFISKDNKQSILISDEPPNVSNLENDIIEEEEGGISIIEFIVDTSDESHTRLRME
ncbi:MAG: hypothetical protein A2Y33_05750 [Spirochaetes bacterium GWF1_51_8]|nr:MAG: hypothetical protein A2Y33_05750 [Spirochaetes bacterium GWF1_51_8]